MFRSPFSTFAAFTGGVAMLGLAACGDGVPTEPAAGELSPSFAAHAERTEVNRGLAAARAGTAEFQRLEAAMDAGYGPITACVAHPEGQGAMGFHYGNPALIGDEGALDVSQPEVLVYAPWRNGELRLVAVEWIVPGTGDEDPPELLGHHFHYVEDAEVWGLHAWIWQHNPDGVFADFNPRVSCDTED